MKMEELVKGLNFLGLAYGKEYSQMEAQQIYEFVKEYDYDTFIRATKEIIRTSKFVPKIADLIEVCDKQKETKKVEVIEYMMKSGYFHKGLIRQNGEQIMLDDIQAFRNYEKATRFLERGIVPDWLQRDINYYFGIMQQEKLIMNENKMLN